MEQAQLPVAQRAALALAVTPEYERGLRELACKHVAITAITNVDGYKDCHSARMELKNVRLEIEKKGKAAREDAQAFSKAVIAEEKRLIAILAAEEQRLQKLQDEWAAAREAERLAAERAEKDRVAAIEKRIADMDRLPSTLVGKTAVEVAKALVQLRSDNPETWAQELLPKATFTHRDTIDALERMHESRAQAEMEALRQAEERARLAKEGEELERRREAQRAAEADAAHQREAADRKAREQIEAEQRAARARIEEEQRQAKLAREEDDRKAREARQAEEDRLRADRQKLEDEQRELERKAREEQFAKDEAARAVRLEEQRQREAAENARQQAEHAKRMQEAERLEARQMLERFLERFGARPEYGFIVVAIRSFLEKKAA